MEVERTHKGQFELSKLEADRENELVEILAEVREQEGVHGTELPDRVGQLLDEHAIAEPGRREEIRATIVEAIEVLYLEAHTDSQTGLGNQRAFIRHLLRAEARAKRTDRPLFAGAIDIEGMGKWNEKNHATGDRVIAIFGRALAEAGRRFNDAAYRIAGDQFAYVLEDTESPFAYFETLNSILREPGNLVDGEEILYYPTFPRYHPKARDAHGQPITVSTVYAESLCDLSAVKKVLEAARLA